MFPQSIDFNKIEQEMEEDEQLEFNGTSYLYDFKKGDFIYKDGNPVLVTGREAIKIWIEKILRTKIYTYGIYEDRDEDGFLRFREYGSNILDLVRGKKLPHLVLKAEIIRDIEESMAYNDKIKRVEDIQVTMGEGGDPSYKMRIEFTVILVDEDNFKMEVDM